MIYAYPPARMEAFIFPISEYIHPLQVGPQNIKMARGYQLNLKNAISIKAILRLGKLHLT